MRYEHVIIYRGLDELRAQADDAAAAEAFSRRADNLLGVVLAHFELEEEVLFPVLDRALGGRALGTIAYPFDRARPLTAPAEPLARATEDDPW